MENTGWGEDNSVGAVWRGVEGLSCWCHNIWVTQKKGDIFKKTLKGTKERNTTKKPKFKVGDHCFVFTSPGVSWLSPVLFRCTSAGKRWIMVGYGLAGQ